MKASREVDVMAQKVTAGKLTGESGASSFMLAYIMGFVLYMAMVLYGVQVMGSVMEEKTNRIAEVLASSVTPFQMMLGKVLGVGGVGLLQLSIWGGTAMLLTTYRGPLAKLLGASPESLSAMQLPSVRPVLLAVFLIYFVLGFLLVCGGVRGGGGDVQLAAGGAAGKHPGDDVYPGGVHGDVLAAQRAERLAGADAEPDSADVAVCGTGAVFAGADPDWGIAVVDGADVGGNAAGGVGGGAGSIGWGS